MVQQLLVLFAPMLFGAQALLTLVLIKGDICPGQRGRIHKMIPAIGVLWLAVASLRIEAFMVVFALFFFYSRVQTKKTRDKGPMWAMHLANGLAISYLAIEASQQVNSVATMAMVVMVGFLGASFGHLLMTIARTRLQAFHRILPVVGVISGMLLVVSALMAAYQLDPNVLETVTQHILIALSLVISAVVVWCWHLFTSKAPHNLQLAFALGLALLATFNLQGLFTLVG